ncbi:acyl-CoA thioesterase [Moraxella macacae]|nr:acyl-CoA thioesterase [Moraxella macacae]
MSDNTAIGNFAIGDKTIEYLKNQISSDKQNPLLDFAVIYEQNVAWGDMDAFAHVNNVVYYEYAQSARIHYLEQLAMFDKNAFTVIASSSCQYLRPITFPDNLLIGVRCKKIGNTSLVQEYIFYSTAQQAVAATAETVIVFFDDTGTQKRTLSDVEKQRFVDLDAKTVRQRLAS